jgi:hypothetical protein
MTAQVMPQETDKKQDLSIRYEAFSHKMHAYQVALEQNDIGNLPPEAPQHVKEILRVGFAAAEEPLKAEGLMNSHHAYIDRLSLLGYITQPHDEVQTTRESINVLNVVQKSLTLAAAASALADGNNRDIVFLYVTRKVEEAGLELSGVSPFVNRNSPTWLYYLYARRILDQKFAVDESRQLDESIILENMVTTFNDIFSLQRPENHP